MKRIQLAVLLTGIALIIFSELFPHWYYEDVDTSAQRSAGYHMVTTAPVRKPADELRGLFAYSNEHQPRFPESVVLLKNTKRQLWQEVFVTLFTLSLLVYFREMPSKNSRRVGFILILFGFPALAMLVLNMITKGF